MISSSMYSYRGHVTSPDTEYMGLYFSTMCIIKCLPRNVRFGSKCVIWNISGICMWDLRGFFDAGTKCLAFSFRWKVLQFCENIRRAYTNCWLYRLKLAISEMWLISTSVLWWLMSNEWHAPILSSGEIADCLFNLGSNFVFGLNKIGEQFLACKA